MQNTKLIFSLLIFSTLFTGCASSIKTSHAPTPLDFVHDEVTSSDLRDHVCDEFQKIDANKDGALQPDEAQNLPKWIGEVKPHKPGAKITIVDVVDAAHEKFKHHAKKKKSNSLTKEEFHSLREGK